MKPGLFLDLDIDTYHADTDTISKSGLDEINVCPALYYARHLDPKRPPTRERAGQLEGALAHCAILEPSQFGKRYTVLPKDAPRRPSEAQLNAKKNSPESLASIEWWADWNATHAGGTVITSAQAEVAWRQAEAVQRIPEVADVLRDGHAEVSACWRDVLSGELCRCRPDWVFTLRDKSVILLDVKTFSSAAPDEFRRQIARKRYHVQAAYYTHGYARASGRVVRGFVFLTVEPEFPYLASALMLDEDGIVSGEVAYRRNLDTYAQCKREGLWPSYSDEIAIVSLPNWATEGV
jgi:exodeoxyribonuclease VIII